MSNHSGLGITWLGHAGVHIVTPAGTSILIDAWLENPKFPKDYAMPEKVDLLLITHGHSDHMGSLPQIVKRYKPTVLAVFELAQWLTKEGVEKVTGFSIGGQFQAAKDVNVVMTDARHSSGIDEGGKFLEGGVATGFILEIAGAPTLYHAGDTGVFSDMKLLADLYAPKIAMLPIGDFYTMGPRPAALAAELLGGPTVLPIHFGTFPALTGTPEALETEIARRGSRAKVIAWQPGETFRPLHGG